MMQYKTYADSDSMYNTPPTFAWYLSGMVFKWLKRTEALRTKRMLMSQKLTNFILTSTKVIFIKMMLIKNLDL